MNQVPQQAEEATVKTATAAEAAVVGDDHVVWRDELQAKLDVSSRTLSRYIVEGRVPKPDTYLTRQRYGWHLSTLRRLGLL